jgi:L-cysteine:1D-myo-inositol 2-amino-2-deoxy-alpha-D-glucopyranoside ligase
MDSWRAVSVPSLPGRGPEPYIHDTATGDVVRAAAGPTATMYACGITPYDSTHIGHAATFLAWDLLVRAWRDAGHNVIYVQNVTDVDDPLLERAARDGEDWRELADREIARYRDDMEALRVLPPTRLVGAVEALPVIERFSRRLAERGSLYDLEGDLYFSRASDPAFGSVSRLDPAAMAVLFGERGGDPSRPGKKDPLDCQVWLAARPGEPSWVSAFGPGRPGWHVECAAIATEYLGRVFDVQAGGSDLIFPHHEMSASHARVAIGEGPRVRPNGAGVRAFARHYLHAGMVRLDGEKMSKSLGNLVFVSSLLADGTDPMAIRLAILAHRYRDDWDWTAAGLAAAEERLARWRAAVGRLLAAPQEPAPPPGAPTSPSEGRAPRPGAPLSPSDGRVSPSEARVSPSGPPPPTPEARVSPSGPPLSPPEAPTPPSGASPSPPGALASPAGALPSAEALLAAARERMADDLDAPGALAAIDRWADGIIAAPVLPPGPRAAALLVRDAADALLGIAF